jgi:hypothetical protein
LVRPGKASNIPSWETTKSSSRRMVVVKADEIDAALSRNDVAARVFAAA